jgi:hypothetical protein
MAIGARINRGRSGLRKEYERYRGKLPKEAYFLFALAIFATVLDDLRISNFGLA